MSFRVSPHLVALLVLIVPSTVLAFDSACYCDADSNATPESLATNATTECSGGRLLGITNPNAFGVVYARGRWIGPSSEHYFLWRDAMIASGLPASLRANVHIRQFTSGGTLSRLSHPVCLSRACPSYDPVDFTAAEAVVDRTLSIGELAQLPDFSYALWDWASGNERPCPSSGIGGFGCHSIPGHTGLVNANHFLPTAREWHRHYHALAISRATHCPTLTDAIPSVAGMRYGLACEEEAMMLEAVAQHFLQDGWSAGHMWERWGSANLADFGLPLIRVATAGAVAVLSGIIHGTGEDDALAMPGPDGRFVSAMPTTTFRGLGDWHRAELEDADFREQHDRLFGCSVASLRDVYSRTRRLHGEIGPGLTTVSYDFSGDACMGQRATNRAIQSGLGPAVNTAASGFLRLVDRTNTPEIRAWIADNTGVLPRTLVVLANRAFAAAERDPDGTELATGGLGPVFGIRPNSAYATATLAPYVDPSLPWPSGSGEARDRSTVLARVFHQSHVQDWCATMTSADLTALRSRASRSAAACQACVEIVSRHVEPGSDAHPSRSPFRRSVCRRLIGDTAAVVHEYPAPWAGADELAARACGCPRVRPFGTAPTEEHCNGFDDDGDSQVDEGCGTPAGSSRCTASVTPGCGDVAIPGGTFEMNSDPAVPFRDGTVQHEIGVSAFRMDTHEVTVGRFRAYWDAGHPAPPALIAYPRGEVPSGPVRAPGTASLHPLCRWTPSVAGVESHPINCIDRATAQAFCYWDHGRLPTEAEWEWVARARPVAGTTAPRAFPWGSEAPTGTPLGACTRAQWNICRGDDAPGGGTRRVGSFPATGGLFDLAGNVAEWTADDRASYDDPETWGDIGRLDPVWSGFVVSASLSGIVRGGDIQSASVDDLRSAQRGSPGIDQQLPSLGFRCVRSP